MLDLTQQRNFIESLELPPRPLGITEQGAEDAAKTVFDKAKEQAQVVGSAVFAFAVGVDNAVREAISDSALLAQLVANQKVDNENPFGWFKIYSGVLQNVGWVLQDKDVERLHVERQRS